MGWTRRAIAGTGLGLWAGGAIAQVPPQETPPAPSTPTFSADQLRRGQMTVAVRIDGRGPFTFAIDSAANASVIAEDLAVALGLPSAGDVAMHTLIAREVVGTVQAPRLTTGALDVARVRLALGSRAGLDGLDGLIGSDLLAGLRLELRFRGAQRMRVTRSHRTADRFLDARSASARLIPAAEQRFGGLMAIAAHAGQARAVAILDTGAQISIANSALATAARAAPITLRDGGDRARVQSPTGRSADARPMLLSGLRFGGLTIGRMPLLVGDFHTFGLWGLADRPALLMGVDIFGMFESVAIDLKRGEVLFQV
jgi:hypothetical protein